MRTRIAAATATGGVAAAAAASAELAVLAAESRHELGAPIGRGCALRLIVDDMGSTHRRMCMCMCEGMHMCGSAPAAPP